MPYRHWCTFENLQKDGPIVADRAFEVWERMPERQAQYGLPLPMLQVRMPLGQVKFLRGSKA